MTADIGDLLSPCLSHLVIHSLDVGDVHVVGGRADILILLTREDVDANQVHLHKKHTQTHTYRIRNNEPVDSVISDVEF